MSVDDTVDTREEVVKGALDAIDEICIKSPWHAVNIREELVALGINDKTLSLIKKTHGDDPILSSYVDGIFESKNRLQAKSKVIEYYVMRIGS